LKDASTLKHHRLSNSSTTMDEYFPEHGERVVDLEETNAKIIAL